MQRFLLGAALAAGLCTAHAAPPPTHALLHGVFKPAPDSQGEGAIHPLPPLQRIEAMDKGALRIVAQDSAEGMAFPMLAAPGGGEPADLGGLGEGDFMVPLDMTGTGVSDLIHARRGAPGWKVLTNAARLPKPAQGFVAGHFEKGAETARCELIPADTSDLAVDQNLLAATGDFLGNGTEQLAYTRPGQHQMWIVGAHGATTMKADLKGIEPAAEGPRCHWLFPFKANRRGQRTRLAYYRAGSDHLIRLVPKGMEFVQERVPLKGHWERLNQAVVDWPRPAPIAIPAEAKEPAGN
ncbi:hypothetical protein [Mesoterricola silvestris]|uniref:Uncharacterized protein n=1 Tax=Mesoterricola silvestris TaxID=2927979 RepID=A0AA48GTS9_9BACT|nr:hypothetical protein [Mesoterricola silvestris]BDU71626.1 hypothetical protein METEAL_08000 [Mesoterricola silvestris]